MAEFMKGLALCEDFFNEIAEPILYKHFPELVYSAGLIGYGSDVLGYDDKTSIDHMWGPRFYLFLNKEDLRLKDKIEEVFSSELPFTYKEYSINFTEPDTNGNGVRLPKFITDGKVSSLIFIYNLDDFIEGYLGKSDLNNLDYLDWLTFSEHRLLALTSGKIFKDMLGIKDRLSILSYYPEEVKLYMMASNWAIISQEQAFVKRCGDCGDDIGSRIVTARIVDRLMRLCFLYKNKYAPYSKWFGTAFNNLDIDYDIVQNIRCAISSDNLLERENYLVTAQKLVGEMHNKKRITEPVECSINSYYERDIKVIFTENFTEAIMRKLKGTPFEKMPLISTFSQTGNLPALYDDCKYIIKVKEIYRP